MVACSNDESESNAVAQSDVISFTAGMANDGVTRAAVDIQGAAFDENEDIRLEMTAAGYEAKNAVYTTAAADGEGKNAMTIKDGSIAFTWPATGTVAIKAFYPYVDLEGTDNDIIITSTTPDFTVKTDQSTPANYKKSDLMYSNNITAQVKQAGAVGLTFNHALTKIIVNLTAGTGVTADDIAACTVTLSAKKTAAITSGVAGDASGDAATITMGTGANNAAIIVPQSYAADANFITVTTAGNHAKTFQLSTAKEFTAGKVYTYNLTVNMAEITMQSTTISEWTPEDAIEGSVTL
jgi:hypothetical protein